MCSNNFFFQFQAQPSFDLDVNSPSKFQLFKFSPFRFLEGCASAKRGGIELLLIFSDLFKLFVDFCWRFSSLYWNSVDLFELVYLLELLQTRSNFCWHVSYFCRLVRTVVNIVQTFAVFLYFFLGVLCLFACCAFLLFLFCFPCFCFAVFWYLLLYFPMYLASSLYWGVLE